MSGLEGIAALGLACNILQLIGTVGGTITVARNILETGTIDPDVEKRTDELATLFREAEGSLSQTSRHKDDQELQVAAGQVLKATSKFKSEFAKISGGASKGKIRQVIGGTLKSIWRRQKLDMLEAEISRCRGMFESRLLLSLRYVLPSFTNMKRYQHSWYASHRIDLGALQREESFDRLDIYLQNFIKSLSSGHIKLEGLIRSESTTLMAHVTEESRQTRQEISTAMNTVVLKMSQEDKQRFIKSVRYETMNERHNRVEVVHPGTYEWIFYDGEDVDEDYEDYENNEDDEHDEHDEHDEDVNRYDDARYVPEDSIPDFIKSTSKNIYWISGKPGSGKSTLMKFMVEDHRMKNLLNQVSPTGTSTIASHFIWAAGTLIQRSLRGTLSSLLFQLITQDEGVLESLVSKCPNKAQRLSLSDWSDQQLAEALKAGCCCSRNTTCLFIDGLDEIHSDDTDKMLAVIDDVCTATNVKCIASSRPEHIFLRYFRKLEAPYLRMQDLTGLDIRRYVIERFSSSHDSDRFRHVVNTLCDKADGVFLWVALALKGQRLSADYEDDPQIVARRFQQLPSGLSELYRNMWDRLNDDKAIYGEEGAKYLNTHSMVTKLAGHTMTIPNMAFATHPTLIMESLEPSSPPILQHVEHTLEKVAVWLEVRTAGLIEVNPKTKEIELVHRSALEFLQNDAKGLEITGLDQRTEEERKLSLRLAGLAVVKYECDIDRLGQFIFLEHERILPYDLCQRTNALLRELDGTMCLYKSGEITKAGFLKVLEQAASTYHAISLMGNKYPFRQCEKFLSSMSSDFLGFMARTGFIEYVSTKVEKLSTEKKPSLRYLEYLWAETCYGVLRPGLEYRINLSEPKPADLRQWLKSLLTQHNFPSPGPFLGGYQRTSRGLICRRPLQSASDFGEYEEAASGTEDRGYFLRDVLPEDYVLLQVSGNWMLRSNHLFEHDQDFNVLIELPSTMLVKINEGKKRWLYQEQFDFSDFSESLISEMSGLKARLLIIQSWVSTSESSEFLDVCPERYFFLKTEQDERFVTSAVVRFMVRTAFTSRTMDSALSEFVNSRIANNGFETISPSQFEDALIERGHAFRSSQEKPWPLTIFEGMAGQDAENNSGIEDYPIAPAAKDGHPAQVYAWWTNHKLFNGVIEGDVLRVI